MSASSPSQHIPFLTCIKPVTFPRAVPACTSCSLISWSFGHRYHHKAFNGCFWIVGSKLHKTTIDDIRNSMNCDRSLSNVGGHYHLQTWTQRWYREPFNLNCAVTSTSAPGLTYKILQDMTVPVNALWSTKGYSKGSRNRPQLDVTLVFTVSQSFSYSGLSPLHKCRRTWRVCREKCYLTVNEMFLISELKYWIDASQLYWTCNTGAGQETGGAELIHCPCSVFLFLYTSPRILKKNCSQVTEGNLILISHENKEVNLSS